MVEFIIGDYQLKDGDILMDRFKIDHCFKNAFNSGKRLVFFAEDSGIGEVEAKIIAKKSTANIIVVCSSKKVIGAMRRSKKVEITYSEGYAEAQSPFDIALSVLKCEDRKYLFDFFKRNKPNLFMVVKSLISTYRECSKHNQNCIAWVDTNLFRVNPEILYAFLSFKFKLEPYIRYIKWNFPKKQEEKK